MAKPSQQPQSPETDGVPFGVNELRLGARHWLWVLGLVFVFGVAMPTLWRRVERFEIGPDYRLPYALSKDYWLYQWRLAEIDRPDAVVVMGDSVVWGEYVAPDGTLSHFLDTAAAQTNRFINAGINGMFPLALEGLHRAYGAPIHHRKVLLHCNLLWMSSPKADLSTTKEETFNHVQLVPQFTREIPCYKADAQARINAVLQRNIPVLAWVQHLQIAYFGERNFLAWTLADDGGDPPRYTNAWRNPLRQIQWTVPRAPERDSQRGPASARHKAWNTPTSTPVRFDWVAPEQSLQWQAFQRLVTLLRSRGNDVCVVLGPFNEELMDDSSRVGYRALRDAVERWLESERIRAVLPSPLPTHLYADASHPLTEGYQRLAKQLLDDPTFRGWIQSESK